MSRRLAIPVMLLALVLSACGGWHLRGAALANLGIESIAVRADSAPLIGAELVRQLGVSGVPLVAPGAPADVLLIVRNETFDTRVLSVEAETGKVREVELGLRVEFEFVARDGQPLAPPDALVWSRDYVFDETALLGTVEQDQSLRLNLATDAAYTLLLRLQALARP